MVYLARHAARLVGMAGSLDARSSRKRGRNGSVGAALADRTEAGTAPRGGRGKGAEMKERTPRRRWTLGAALLALAATSANPGAARADDAGKPATETFAIHGQATVVDQATLPFHAPYAGANSLTPKI